VDTVFALDVIEHLLRADGERLLQEVARVAYRQIVVFTPLGFMPQSYDNRRNRIAGDGRGYWQTHRSA